MAQPPAGLAGHRVVVLLQENKTTDFNCASLAAWGAARWRVVGGATDFGQAHVLPPRSVRRLQTCRRLLTLDGSSLPAPAHELAAAALAAIKGVSRATAAKITAALGANMIGDLAKNEWAQLASTIAAATHQP